MTSKTFFIQTIGISLIVVTIVILVNIRLNDYGLFGDMTGRKLKIYSYLGSERLSKYLFSYNYIPSNFEGILIGSSLSDNLDTRLIENFKIYNGSLIGGNISELRLIMESLLNHNRHVKFMVICLEPYITKDSGKKTSYINPREYWGSLGSLDTLKLYVSKFLVHTGVLPDYCNEYGCYNFYVDKMGIDSKRAIQETAKNTVTKKPIEIDGTALKELRELIENTRRHGLRIFAYYHPHPYEIYAVKKDAFEEYEKVMNSLFSSEDFVWNFNDDSYKTFTKDYTNFCDSDHLSERGAHYLLEIIEKNILQVYSRGADRIEEKVFVEEWRKR